MLDTNLGIWSLLPPVLAIALAIASKRVLPSLLLGIIASQALLSRDAPHLAPFLLLEHMLEIAARPGNLQLIVFSLLIGGLLKLMKDAGGFAAFVALVGGRDSHGSKPRAYGATYLLGTGLFLEVWSNVLINGTSVGPLYDRMGVSRQRMAYFVHTVAIAAVSLIPINSWAAFYMGLLIAQGVEDPFAMLLKSIPFMIYSWISLLLVAYVMLSGLSLGAMRTFEAAAREAAARQSESDSNKDAPDDTTGRLSHVLTPLITLIGTLLISLYATGGGNITQGDGATAILHAVVAAIIALSILLLAHRRLKFVEIEEKLVAGMGEFIGMAVLILFALCLGDLCQMLGTGAFLGALAQNTLPSFMLPALVFVLGASMSFATGTSYGTFSIMVPIALPVAQAAGVDPYLMFGAVIAGGVFGDNCSPISDTTIVTSLGCEVRVIDHVNTQLPYALLAAGLTIVCFTLLGLL